MNILLLPNDIIYYITRFLPITDKIVARETSIEFYKEITYMEIRVANLNLKFDKILNGRTYILSRLRLASLCGLHEHSVATIWAWITLLDDVKSDSLPILRQISSAIYKID